MDLEDQELQSPQQIYPNQKYPIDGQVFKALIESSLAWLRTNQQVVNVLNVYPIPDGDTGTNMVLTMQAAYEKIQYSTDRNIGKLTGLVADGALNGARGNSGVILSQIWRGFARVLDSIEALDSKLLIAALREGQITAYNGVIKPVEGTILTVAKDVAAEAQRSSTDTQDPYDILERIVIEADASVQRTPDLLPVLKKAGVVDAGGKGLFYIFEGMSRYVKGLPLDTITAEVQPLSGMKYERALESIEPGQDFEIVVDFSPYQKLNIPVFYQDLQKLGTSIQLGEGSDIYRLHIHVPEEKELETYKYIKSVGRVTKAAIENLQDQMEDIKHKSSDSIQCEPVEPGQIATVAVVPGAGIARVFASMGVSAIVEGGQTMNPSTQEILNAFEQLPTDQVIILPNNKNIILAAQSAVQLTKKQAKVIPSKSVPQGMAAMLRMIPSGDMTEVYNEMIDALSEVTTGEITTATRDVKMDGVNVKKGQIICLMNGKIVFASNNLKKAVLGLLEKAQADQKEVIDLFYGSNVLKEEVDAIENSIRKKYPDHQLEVHEGGQPYYQFIISIQ